MDESLDKHTDGAGNEISRLGTSNVSFHNACGGKFISPAPFFPLFPWPLPPSHVHFSVPLWFYFLLCSFTYYPHHILVAPFPHSFLQFVCCADAANLPLHPPPMTWWQLHAPAIWLVPFCLLWTSHHCPIYSNVSTCCQNSWIAQYLKMGKNKILQTICYQLQ